MSVSTHERELTFPVFENERLGSQEYGGEEYEAVEAALNQVIDLDALRFTPPEVLLKEAVRIPKMYEENGGLVRVTSLDRQPNSQEHVTQYFKDETQQPTRAFKVRGAFVAGWLALRENPNIRLFAAATAGNHGLGLTAFANWCNQQSDGSRFEAHVFCSNGASVEKVDMLRSSGAQVHQKDEHGKTLRTLEDAGEASGAFVSSQNSDGTERAKIIPPFDSPEVMAGQATQLLEIVTQLSEAGTNLLEAPLVVRGGSGGVGKECGIAVLMDRMVEAGLLHPDSCVVATQMEGCDSMVRKLALIDQGRGDEDVDLFLTPDGTDTFDPSADGTAVRKPGKLNVPLAYYLRQKGRLMLVSVPKVMVGKAMQRAAVHGYRVEPAAALSLAGSMAYAEANMVEHITNPDSQTPYVEVCILSGGNMSLSTEKEFNRVVAEHPLGRLAIANGASTFAK